MVSTWTKAGLAVTRVNTFAEASREPQLQVRDMLQETQLVDGTTEIVWYQHNTRHFSETVSAVLIFR